MAGDGGGAERSRGVVGRGGGPARVRTAVDGTRSAGVCLRIVGGSGCDLPEVSSRC